jgi:hypothetical protein
MTITTGLSVEEYLARDFPPRTQLVDGELVVNQPTFRHQRIADTVIANRRSTPKATKFDELLELRTGDTLTSPLFQDFALDVGEIFDR